MDLLTLALRYYYTSQQIGIDVLIYTFKLDIFTYVHAYYTLINN